MTRGPNGRAGVAVMDVFWNNPAGYIEHAYNYPNAPVWQFDGLPHSSQFSGPDGPIAAVSRAANTWEIFYDGQAGTLQGAYWYDPGGQPFGYENGPIGQYQLASPREATPWPIAAVSRGSNNMEVFRADPIGNSLDHYYYDGAGWNSETIPGAGFDGLTASSRAANTVEVWGIDGVGAVQDSYLYGCR